MVVRWRLADDAVHLRLEGTTTGWIAVGFNRTDTLAGSRLLMATVDGEEVRVDEHMADPPNHATIARPDGRPSVAGVSGGRAGGTTWVEFRVPLDSAGTATKVKAATGGSYLWTPLHAGARLWVTLAWSHDRDLQHHSAMRTARWADL